MTPAAMTPEIRSLAGEWQARLNRCDNGEGMQCSNLDDALRQYGEVCCEYWSGVRSWADSIFKGQSPSEPEVERLWKEAGEAIYDRATRLAAFGREAESSCFRLDGRTVLESALWRLHQLLHPWVSPQLSVAPGPRRRIDPAQVPESIRRLNALPGLPPDWKPDDPELRKEYERRLRQLAS